MMVKRFMPRHSTIEAVQFDGYNHKEINNWLKIAVFSPVGEEDRDGDPDTRGEIFTDGRRTPVLLEEWIVKFSEEDVVVMQSMDGYTEWKQEREKDQSSGPHISVNAVDNHFTLNEVKRKWSERSSD